MSDVWSDLFNAVKDNNVVQVNLTPGTRIVQPKRTRSGRPRIVRSVRYGHYAGYDEAAGGRPRCALPGCSKYLKIHQAIACCADHETKVVVWARSILARLSIEEKYKAA